MDENKLYKIKGGDDTLTSIEYITGVVAMTSTFGLIPISELVEVTDDEITNKIEALRYEIGFLRSHQEIGMTNTEFIADFVNDNAMAQIFAIQALTVVANGILTGEPDVYQHLDLGVTHQSQWLAAANLWLTNAEKKYGNVRTLPGRGEDKTLAT